MDQVCKRDKAPLEVRLMPAPGTDARSCVDCRNVRMGYFPWCKAFDKPTSGNVNGCLGFEEKKR